MATARAVFAVDLETGGVVEGSNAAAGSLQKLNSQITGEKTALKELEAQLKLFQGSTKVNTGETDRLKEAIGKKKDLIQQSSESYAKLGGKLTELGKKSKDTRAATAELGTAGGVAAKGMQDLGAKAGGAGVASKALGAAGAAGGGGMAALGGGIMRAGAAALRFIGPAGAAFGAVMLAGGAAYYAAGKFAAYGIAQADAARSAKLQVVAMMGSEKAAGSLAARVHGLSKTLPMARTELLGIAQSLNEKGLKGSAMESALGAIGRTQSVLGQAAAGKIQGIVEQSKALKKFQASVMDLEGSGITIDDIAEKLADRTKVSLRQARESIKAGAVDLKTGLSALDAATDAKLGIHARKMSLSLSSLATRAKESFGTLFAGVNPEPVLKAISKFVDLLDESSVTGRALRDLLSGLLQPLVDGVGSQGSTVVEWFQDLLIWTYQVAIGMRKAKMELSAFADDPLEGLSKLTKKMGELGKDMIAGLVKAIQNGAEAVAEAVLDCVDGAIDKGKEALGIKSPSKVFYEIGAFTIKGFEEGVAANQNLPAKAIDRALDIPASATAPTSSTSIRSTRGPTYVTLNVYGGDLEEVRRTVENVLEVAGLQSGAIPTGKAA